MIKILIESANHAVGLTYKSITHYVQFIIEWEINTNYATIRFS